MTGSKTSDWSRILSVICLSPYPDLYRSTDENTGTEFQTRTSPMQCINEDLKERSVSQSHCEMVTFNEQPLVLYTSIKRTQIQVTRI